jgi:hypothetical protein
MKVARWFAGITAVGGFNMLLCLLFLCAAGMVLGDPPPGEPCNQAGAWACILPCTPVTGNSYACCNTYGDVCCGRTCTRIECVGNSSCLSVGYDYTTGGVMSKPCGVNGLCLPPP